MKNIKYITINGGGFDNSLKKVIIYMKGQKYSDTRSSFWKEE